MRTCLRLDVTPVFAPPRESGFQAAIENFNGRWQAKVWARFRGALTGAGEISREAVDQVRKNATGVIAGVKVVVKEPFNK